MLALRLGARIHAIRFVIPAVYERDGVLLAAYKGLIEQRARDAKTYGKKSPQELGDKLMNNAGYGKHGQDVSPKTVRSLRSLEMEDRGTSQVTNPVVAAMSTALPRVLLLAAANQLHSLGYHVYSETTDGFISDAPADVLAALDLFGFADRMRYVRAYYSDGTDAKIWEIKHTQHRLLNQTTRLNIGFEEGGVLARGGFKGYKPLPGEKDVSGERREQFAHDVVTRDAPLGYVSRDWVSPADMLDYDEDMHVYEGRHAANPNFDMKRSPDLDTMHDIEFACAGDVVRVANYETRTGSRARGVPPPQSDHREASARAQARLHRGGGARRELLWARADRHRFRPLGCDGAPQRARGHPGARRPLRYRSAEVHKFVHR